MVRLAQRRESGSRRVARQVVTDTARVPNSVAGKAGRGHVGRIPVRNLWLLMLYASEFFRMHGRGRMACEDSPEELLDLVAEILAHAVEKRQRRQLSLGYRRRNTVINRVRGRIDVLKTTRGHLLSRGRVACEFDELTIDTPRNRFVRGALERAWRLATGTVALRCRKLAHELRSMGVAGTVPSVAEVQTECVGRQDLDDRFMVAAAKLVFDLALPTEMSGIHFSPLPDREAQYVRHLFERAVGGFYSVVLENEGWRVSTGRWFDWHIERRTAKVHSILPKMKTDVVLEHRASQRRIVIDTKFTAILTSGYYREQTLRSGYLFQIYAYLRSQAGRGSPVADRAEGLLLHPSVGEDVDEAVVIQGHSIRFATVDLAARGTGIRQRLLDLVKPTPTLRVLDSR